MRKKGRLPAIAEEGWDKIKHRTLKGAVLQPSLRSASLWRDSPHLAFWTEAEEKNLSSPP
jgi:hypothetical protein